ncbi:MAG: POTRA domain-containing protein, partial [Verrucomicrobiota bacterium]
MPESLRAYFCTILLMAAGTHQHAQAEHSAKVRIEGLQSVDESAAKEWLAPQLKFIETSGVSRAKADDIAYFLETALLDRGYEGAEVEWRVDGEGENGIIFLSVSEGRPQGVRQFLISGNESLEDAAIIELLTETTRKRLGLKPQESVPFVPSDIKAGTKKIIDFYSLLGHVEASVEANPDSSMAGTTVAVTINEGPQFVVGEVVLPEAPTSRLEEVFETTISEFSGK